MKNGYNNLTEDEISQAEDVLDPFSFEKYCGNCIFFNTNDCPHIENVCDMTNWETEIHCDKFFD